MKPVARNENQTKSYAICFFKSNLSGCWLLAVGCVCGAWWLRFCVSWVLGRSNLTIGTTDDGHQSQADREEYEDFLRWKSERRQKRREDQERMQSERVETHECEKRAQEAAPPTPVRTVTEAVEGESNHPTKKRQKESPTVLLQGLSPETLANLSPEEAKWLAAALSQLVAANIPDKMFPPGAQEQPPQLTQQPSEPALSCAPPSEPANSCAPRPPAVGPTTPVKAKQSTSADLQGQPPSGDPSKSHLSLTAKKAFLAEYKEKYAWVDWETLLEESEEGCQPDASSSSSARHKTAPALKRSVGTGTESPKVLAPKACAQVVATPSRSRGAGQVGQCVTPVALAFEGETSEVPAPLMPFPLC